MDSPQSAGGRATALKSRAQAIQRYNENPNKCKFCQEIIHVGDQTVSKVRVKAYCNSSCSARAHPQGTPCGPCTVCGVIIQFRLTKKQNFVKRKFCAECLTKFRAEVVKKVRPTKVYSDEETFKRTKAELFASRSTWQSARSSIRRHAARVYKQSNGPMTCFVCGYSTHVEIAHKKPVASFPGEATLAEINARSNLVALCPNHHWEFDAGFLVLAPSASSRPAPSQGADASAILAGVVGSSSTSRARNC